MNSGVMVVLGLTTLTVALTDLKPYTHLQVVPHMTTYHQVCHYVTLNLPRGDVLWNAMEADTLIVLENLDPPVCVYEFGRVVSSWDVALSRRCAY